mmetsp:Transcript_2924/g.6890  ORF Transcript_2924/g.6890 Transcript_2924/m.6890 type:complete len:105 (+) Transcript_2924:134-448(+)
MRRVLTTQLSSPHPSAVSPLVKVMYYPVFVQKFPECFLQIVYLNISSISKDVKAPRDSIFILTDALCSERALWVIAFLDKASRARCMGDITFCATGDLGGGGGA